MKTEPDESSPQQLNLLHKISLDIGIIISKNHVIEISEIISFTHHPTQPNQPKTYALLELSRFVLSCHGISGRRMDFGGRNYWRMEMPWRLFSLVCGAVPAKNCGARCLSNLKMSFGNVLSKLST